MRMERGILYLALHNQLTKKYGCMSIIPTKDFLVKIARHGQIPKNLRQFVIKEMEEKELIKRINRDKIQILKIEIDLERDYKKFCELAGLL